MSLDLTDLRVLGDFIATYHDTDDTNLSPSITELHRAVLVAVCHLGLSDTLNQFRGAHDLPSLPFPVSLTVVAS